MTFRLVTGMSIVGLMLSCATALGGKRLLRLELDGHGVVHEEILFRDLARVRDVVAGPDGFLYVALNREFDDSPGEIIRLVPVAPGTTD